MRAMLTFGCVCLLLVLLSMNAWASPEQTAATGASGGGGAAVPCQVQVILFVPADVTPPAQADYQQRIDEMVDYCESFFRRELKRWGHEKAVMPFHRQAGGHVVVTMMRGKEKAARYQPVPLRAEVMNALRRQNKIDTRRRQVWWILVYAGEPPARFTGFLGGFGPQIGGWAVCNYPADRGRIDPAAPLGSEFLEKLTLKGMLHELGHGFGLPHVGPLTRDSAGNTLMGPTHRNFRRVMPASEQRVYLSEAEAAMLSIHPAFRGAPDDRPAELPQTEAQNLEYSADTRSNTIMVRGRVKSPQQRAVYALVADESDTRPGEYWTKVYVGKVAADGDFEVIVSEPSRSNGTLKLWFAFENGAQTGDGTLRGRKGGFFKAYTYAGGQWTFP